MDHSFILSNKMRDYFNDKVKLSFVTEKQVLIVTKDDKVYEFERDSENSSLITFGFNNSIIESKILMELCDKNVVDFAHGDGYCTGCKIMITPPSAAKTVIARENPISYSDST
jgi:hypothetical protein